MDVLVVPPANADDGWSALTSYQLPQVRNVSWHEGRRPSNRRDSPGRAIVEFIADADYDDQALRGRIALIGRPIAGTTTELFRGRVVAVSAAGQFSNQRIVRLDCAAGLSQAIGSEHLADARLRAQPLLGDIPLTGIVTTPVGVAASDRLIVVADAENNYLRAWSRFGSHDRSADDDIELSTPLLRVLDAAPDCSTGTGTVILEWGIAPPGAPTLTQDTPGTITVTRGTFPDGIAAWDLRYRSDAGAWTEVTQQTATTYDLTFTDLVDVDVSLRWRVSDSADADTTGWGPYASLTTNLLPTPSAPTISNTRYWYDDSEFFIYVGYRTYWYADLTLPDLGSSGDGTTITRCDIQYETAWKDTLSSGQDEPIITIDAQNEPDQNHTVHVGTNFLTVIWPRDMKARIRARSGTTVSAWSPWTEDNDNAAPTNYGLASDDWAYVSEQPTATIP